MTALQKALFNKIDEILWKEWDPIGINDNENIRDEYQTYTPQLFRLKTEGANTTQISEYLYQLETISMGLAGDRQRCEIIARKIAELSALTF